MQSDDIGLDDLRQPDDQRKPGWVKTAFFTRILAGLSGGLLAGILLGLIEAFWIMILKGSSADIFGYGMIMYGLIGAGVGLGIGIGFGLIALALGHVKGSLNTFALAFAGWFSLNLLILGKFRLFRDIWKEQALPMTAKLGLLAVSGLAFLVCFYISRRESADTVTKAIRAITASVVLVVLGGVVWIGSMMFTGSSTESSPVIPEQLESAPNVVLIMCDALRADHLGIYGYAEAETPVLDQFAEKGVRFHHAYAQSSWTKPGTATIFTGLYPSGHNTYLKPDILPDSVETVAEVFQKAGYHTFGLPNNINISPGFNFGQGFDEYAYLSPDYFFGASESSSQLTYYSILRLIRERFIFKSKYPENYYQEAKVVNEYVDEYLSQRGEKERFFMYLHYMDPHDPYFRHPFNGVGYARVEMPNPDPSMAEEFVTAYDEEITYLDTRLGELFDNLKKRKLWDNTVICITADHGEEFYEHKGWWHGTTLYQEQIRIPMIFKLQSSKQKSDVRLDNARHIDICTTLLSLSGIPTPDSMMFGRNLFGPSNQNSRNWTVYAEEDHEGNIISSWINGQWKYIQANQENPRGLAEQELYRLDIDPYEKRNQSRNTDRINIMQQELLNAEKEASSNAAERQVKEIDSAELEKMKALGYVSE